MTIRVGTASWTDPSLIKCGRFYPKDAKTPEARLRYYASQFDFVEVDSRYYAMPRVDYVANWADRTPKDFTFNVKAFRLFTGHQTPLDALPKDIREALGTWTKKNIYYHQMPAELNDKMWERFERSLAPLADAGKLGALQFSFAPWFAREPKSLDHLDEIARRLPQHLVAVEFRNKSWFDDEHAAETLLELRENGFANVVLDEPQGFANSVPPVWEVTNTHISVVRLHGRNTATWNLKDAKSAADRFNYDYRDDELRDLADKIKRLAVSAGLTAVVFNNNYEDQGQRNATTLKGMLGA